MFISEDFVDVFVNEAQKYCLEQYGSSEVYPVSNCDTFLDCIIYDEPSKLIMFWFDHPLDDGTLTTSVITHDVEDETYKKFHIGKFKVSK